MVEILNIKLMMVLKEMNQQILGLWCKKINEYRYSWENTFYFLGKKLILVGKVSFTIGKELYNDLGMNHTNPP